MRDAINIHELYQHRLLHLLHSEDTPQDKLLNCRGWLTELSQYPSLAVAIYPCFAACRDALQALVAARPRRGMMFRDSPRLVEYRRRMAELEAEAKARRQQ